MLPDIDALGSPKHDRLAGMSYIESKQYPNYRNASVAASKVLLHLRRDA